MRLSTLIAFIAPLVTMATAHEVSCWGKASHPTESNVQKAISELDDQITSAPDSKPFAVRAKASSCVTQYCQGKTQVRFCNEDDQPKTMRLQNIRDSVAVIFNDCATKYRGRHVAGGVVYHDDQWNVVVQTVDKC
ncbi:hypothetical protein BDV19DRAFT_384655 [Aspergillus venezuelensis]